MPRTISLPPLYPNTSASFDPDLFRTPPAAYRGAPFWSWNTRLSWDRLRNHLDVFRTMGMGGVHIHARTGLDTPYLGDEFMTLVRQSVHHAKTLGLRTWLYDEDRWPSGYGGGQVTTDLQHRAKHLLFTPRPYDGTRDAPPLVSGAKAARFENGVLLARYDVTLNEGRLTAYRRLDDGAAHSATTWYAYLEHAEPSPWWNNQTYADTLSRTTTERFIALTHERYREVVGNEFGYAIPAVFTDEPQFVHKSTLTFAEERRDLFLPWTTDFTDTFLNAYGSDLLDTLPEVFWERPNGAPSVSRYHYHDHIAERFAEAFADTLGHWCEAHGLRLTGHLMEEPTLHSQTAALGEAMRSYRSFHLPGIDILCDAHEYTTAKQAQSAARQYGREGVLSELYGVTNWDYDFAGHKAQGDWQAALGVTVRVHHLAWVSMAGEAKRDYPASIFKHAPWWREYPLVEDHFARLNTVMTRGRPRVRIGVIHPIESYWLTFGPLEHTAAQRTAQDQAFQDLTRWLLFGLLDFDFIAESLLPQLCTHPSNPLPVGQMAYDVIVVPNLRTIRASTLDCLEAFRDAGGTVLFVGEGPDLVDARPSDRPQGLVQRSVRVPMTEPLVLDALEPWRDLDARSAEGTRTDTLLTQLRQDGDALHLFVCNTDRARSRPRVSFRVAGRWKVTQLDTLTGTVHPVGSRYQGEHTVTEQDVAAHGHVLLRYEPGEAVEPHESRLADLMETGRLSDPVPVTLSEPNVLLLDRAAYRLDDEPWRPEEEVLRLDNVLRQQLGWPLRRDAIAQPWTQPHDTPTSRLHLQFTIHATVPVAASMLALERAEDACISLDGHSVDNRPTGWWVDEAIQTVALPPITPGVHTVEVSMPYGPRSNPEWCYLLGEFGVHVAGRHAEITAPVRTLAFGDWTTQGLPFYAGNVTYHCSAPAGQDLLLEAATFNAPLLTASLNGEVPRPLAFAPYRLKLGTLSGATPLDITAYGSRINAFGALHNNDARWSWWGPDAWRTTGAQWCDEYRLRAAGLLVAPRILTTTTRDSA